MGPSVSPSLLWDQSCPDPRNNTIQASRGDAYHLECQHRIQRSYENEGSVSQNCCEDEMSFCRGPNTRRGTGWTHGRCHLGYGMGRVCALLAPPPPSRPSPTLLQPDGEGAELTVHWAVGLGVASAQPGRPGAAARHASVTLHTSVTVKTHT